MSGDDSFLIECERCGREVYYEDAMFMCEMYLCRDCYESVKGRFVCFEVDEDDGYPD